MIMDYHRHSSIKYCLYLIGLGIVLANILAAQPRRDLLINSDWKFARENRKGAEKPQFNDSKWDKISLPHTWNARDGQDGGNDYYRGVGWYRKQVNIDSKYKGKAIFLKFEGAGTVAHVFVNGIQVGTHKGNFGAFCFDVTQAMKIGAQNVIAVKVSNAKDTTVAPLRGDFTIFGGIYRNVHLLILEPLSISPLDFASNGLYIKQTTVDAQRAVLDISTVIRNGSDREKEATVRCTIFDQQGTEVGLMQTKISIPPSAQHVESQQFTLQTPHLWNGITDPYLYTVNAEVLDGATCTDKITEEVGLRYFTVDPDKGFFLNGQSYPLHGVNRHQDRENKGWAIGIKEHAEDFQIIKEMGSNAIRLAHYQHAQDFYNLCDRGGMIVWAELALVDEINPSKQFADNCKQQLTELIKQNFNHPSIVVWSLYNELMPEPNRELYAQVVRSLDTLARQLDPTRLTTMASRSKYEGKEEINTITDLVGYNQYRGWYEGQPEDFTPFIDSIHSRYPNYKLCISEYGAGASPAQHEVPPKKPKTKEAWHPEEWQTHLHQVTWKAMEQRPYLWGTFVWNMFDFASDGRSEGDCYGRNDKGLVSYDRKIKKDAFYWYKANWNPEAMIYIASRRYSPRPAGATQAEVFSNCDSLGFYVNSQKIGMTVSGAKSYQWKDIVLKEGKNVIEAVGYKNGIKIKDSCIWIGTTDEPVKEASK